MFQLGARYTDQRRAQVSETTYQLNVDRVTDEVNTLIKLHRNLAAQYQADQAVLGRSAYQKVFGDFLSGHHRSIESLAALLTKLNPALSADRASVTNNTQAEDDATILRVILGWENHLKQEYVRSLALLSGAEEFEATLTANKGETTKRLGWLEGELNMLDHTRH